MVAAQVKWTIAQSNLRLSTADWTLAEVHAKNAYELGEQHEGVEGHTRVKVYQYTKEYVVLNAVNHDSTLVNDSTKAIVGPNTTREDHNTPSKESKGSLGSTPKLGNTSVGSFSPAKSTLILGKRCG